MPTTIDGAAGTINGNVPLNATSLRTQLNASSAAPIYACRAWVNFDGVTGTIRSSGNVTSVIVNGSGNYTVNLTTPMQDANYAVIASAGDNSLVRAASQVSDIVAGSFRVYVINHGNAFFTSGAFVSAAVFR